MVAFLTGITRAPFTSAIIVLEMTDRHSLIFHLMLAGMVSSIASILVSRHSLYDVIKVNFLTRSEKTIVCKVQVLGLKFIYKKQKLSLTTIHHQLFSRNIPSYCILQIYFLLLHLEIINKFFNIMNNYETVFILTPVLSEHRWRKQ
jgi:hypothetical protein